MKTTLSSRGKLTPLSEVPPRICALAQGSRVSQPFELTVYLFYCVVLHEKEPGPHDMAGEGVRWGGMAEGEVRTCAASCRVGSCTHTQVSSGGGAIFFGLTIQKYIIEYHSLRLEYQLGSSLASKSTPAAR